MRMTTVPSLVAFGTCMSRVTPVPCSANRWPPGHAPLLPAALVPLMVNGPEQPSNPAGASHLCFPNPLASPQGTPPMAGAQLQGSAGTHLAQTCRAGKEGSFTAIF